MPDVANLTLFFVAAIALIVTPGPDTLYVIARSIGQGRAAGVISALGVCAGILVHTLAAAIGLSALLMSSALAYNLVKYAGAAYLVYLGVRTLLSREHTALGTTKRASLTATFSQGVLSNVLNPKVVLFFLAFLPQFIEPTLGNIAWQIMTLGILFVVMTIFWLMLVALFTSLVGHWLQGRSGFLRFQRWFTSSILIGLGARLALPEQR